MTNRPRSIRETARTLITLVDYFFAKSYNIKTLGVYSLIILAFLFSRTATAEDTNTPIHIDDVMAHHNFIALHDLYADGAKKFLCVETAPKTFSLWDPEADKLTSSSANKCPITENMHALFPEVQSEPFPDSPIRMKNDASYSDGREIYIDHEPHNNCDLNFSRFFVITRNGQSEQEFFIISPLLKPETLTMREDCSGNQSVTQEYETVSNLASIALDQKRTLIYSLGHRFIRPVIFIIKGIPNNIWGSKYKVYLIPKKEMDGALAGSLDWQTRYKAVLDLISVK